MQRQWEESVMLSIGKLKMVVPAMCAVFAGAVVVQCVGVGGNPGNGESRDGDHGDVGDVAWGVESWC